MPDRLKDMNVSQLREFIQDLEALMDAYDDAGNYHGVQSTQRQIQEAEQELAAKEASDG